MHHDKHVTDATPEQVHAWLAAGEILLVDVREANEYAFERIHGALLYPLSTFDPAALPAEGRRLVLHCGSGKRSLMAAHKLQAAGHGHLTHLAGGIQAWKAAGLPVIRIDPQTGRVVDDGRR
ncbi:MAG: rhodanese-like domain-containing protein, partial [Vicinamibacterales bacterium]|nr:rhodanese-like domain-containing protein [Vicinamibacterales bacterium]